jgi:hypothetical protein
MLRLRLFRKLRCPYCHGELSKKGRVGRTLVRCEGCDTPHHLLCFVENGRCTVLGCPGERAFLHGEALDALSLAQAFADEVAAPRWRGRLAVSALALALLLQIFAVAGFAFPLRHARAEESLKPG